MIHRLLHGSFAPLRMTGIGFWVLSSVLCLLSSVGCSKRGATSKSEAILRISQRNEPATLDPQVAALPDEFFVLRALCEGLVVPIPSGETEPGAAEKWTTSPDGLRWTFHLRANATWSNGDPVTARDFVFTIRRALTPALGAPKASLFFVLKNASAFYRGAVTDFAQVGAAAPDARTLVLTLEHPTPHLLALLASGPWLPVHESTVEKFGNTRESAWTHPGNFVGNGPFLLTEWQHNQRIVAKKNPHYHRAARVLVDGLSFEAFDNGDSEERAFRAGQVDVTMAVPFSKLATYSSPPRQTQLLAETRYLALNVQRPPLNDPRVRLALSLAIDRQSLVDAALKGGQQPALSLIPPGLGDYELVKRVNADANTARWLLAEAGFPEGRGFPKLELASWQVNVSQLEVVQQMWRRELGIEVAIVQREAKVHQAALRAGDFTIGFMPAIPDYDDPAALFDELATGAANNYSHWSNARYDALVAEAGRTVDPARRLALYHDAESVLLSELPIVPLYFNAQNYLVAPRVRGWRQDGLWTRYYLDVSLSE